MNQKTLRILEYNKIIDMLSERAVSTKGKDMCKNLLPTSDIKGVVSRLTETKEAYDVVLKWGSLPLDGVKDIEDIVKRAKMGFILSPKDFLYVKDSLKVVKRLKSFFSDGSKRENYPIINQIIESLFYIKNLEEDIEKAILGEDEISDRASEKLFSIRRSIKDKNLKVKEKLQSMLYSLSKYLQEPIITVRNGRYVIPVKSEFKGYVQGLIHDQSASGSTLFIEPMPIVELNNEIKELELKEKAEIERILKELSVKVSNYADELLYDNESLAYLDFLMAKAKFGLDLNASIPNVNDEGIIDLKSARHPLIDKEKVVPIDIRLGYKYKVLVITGPNTGGKTVTLKTTGLLTLMAMAGLAVPCKEGSQISVFNKIFADIGDEQSIEQSLSTFSSHMKNIIDIVNQADEKTLVLVDELGAGTDPTEGAALAMSLLEYFYQKGCRVVATTHYSEIKVFAMEKEGFENASVEFDIETLRPTYRLLIGIPGKSNAFEISKRLGLDDAIIKRAKEFISKDVAKFEDVIQKLQNKTLLIERELDEIQKIKRETQDIKEEYLEKKYKFENQREKEIRKAQEEARKIILKAKEEADSIIKELNELRKKALESQTIKQAEEVRKKLKEKINSMDKEEEALIIKDGMIQVKDVKVGDEVFVSTVGAKGIVLSNVDSKGEVLVQIGVMKMSVPLDKLFIEQKSKKEAAKIGASKIIKEKANNISTSIDLRGQTVDEALYNLDKYLDDAFLCGLTKVTIIHGKGTGALREGIQKALKNHSHVKSFRLGDFTEGGSGVTIVEIK
ncbi:DNA mismatch repair protein MutS2 [Caloramator fervidus]|uniref:Endonuclease MutS2 n=1 Tax=Caloramator fervidus TaxID=29344 RepID=A0A1H5U657_9CLOT|nr:endonuclease MutS2 [Caloramator fervidus]SEF70516.1 DNA mismatch repair protein MutS2 [Caloramator fervidus]